MKIQPFDSFKLICKTMANAGYMKPLGEKLTPLQSKLHYMFRIITIFVMVIFDLQHIVFIFQVSGNMNLIVASLFSLIVTINVTVKLFLIFFNTHRYEKLRDDINCELFKTTTFEDELLMIENKRQMDRVNTMMSRAVALCSVFWFSVPFINRMSNPNSIVPAYFPFSTRTFSGFFSAVAFHTAIMFWTGYGHMGYNCFIAAVHSQSCIQLKIIRQKLECLADIDEHDDERVFKDMVNEEVQKRFVHCVLRYKMVHSFSKEVETMLSSSVFMQLFASAGVICMVVFKMSTVKSAIGFEFMYLSVYLFCLLVELFLYCYYGTLVSYESRFVNTSLYLSNWPSLSPRFRRLMLIAMVRWDRTINPLAANLVPLSLNTFLKVLRIAYTLYTVLKES